MTSFINFLIPTRHELDHAHREFWNVIQSLKDFAKDPRNNPLDWDNLYFSVCEASLINAFWTRFVSKDHLIDLSNTGSKHFKYDPGYWGLYDPDMKLQWITFVIFSRYFISTWKSLDEARTHILNDKNYKILESDMKWYSKEEVEFYNDQLQTQMVRDREMLSIAEWFLETMAEEDWQDDPEDNFNSTSDKMFALVVKHRHSMWS